MPAPLPPHPDNPNHPNRKRLDNLSYIDPAKVAPIPSLNGRPADPNVLQLDASFSPHTGDGSWGLFMYPTETWYNGSYDEFMQFRRHVRRLLSGLSDERFEFLLEYLHNYRILNIHLITGEVSAWREGDPNFPSMRR